jgi:hypothetical protein
MQPGDVKETFADVADLEAAVDYAPRIDLETGVTDFAEWHKAWRLRNA